MRPFTSPTGPVTDRQVAAAIGIDTFAIVLFAAIGRREHEQGGGVADVFETAAPFLIGLAVAWLIVRAWRHPLSVYVGIAIWPITVLVGMITRNLVFDRGTAASFVVVATLFIGACLVGWRLAWRLISRRRSADVGDPVAVR
ncbi:MAG: DUF3054 domain-containing protein [Ilumatobacter fluminis]|uniref:DUF3054 domain-containing protein n=1 Tax=Ilumatobacter fluminis TaxID=467091 RepID=UPI0032EBF119